MKTQTAVTALAALAQNSRLTVFRWLVELGPTGACPGEIAEKLGISPTTLSFHLKGLQHSGLIAADKNGRSIRYRANFVVMQALLNFLTKNCCGGDSSKCSPASQSTIDDIFQTKTVRKA